jgi:hypothetical protein
MLALHDTASYGPPSSFQTLRRISPATFEGGKSRTVGSRPCCSNSAALLCPWAWNECMSQTRGRHFDSAEYQTPRDMLIGFSRITSGGLGGMSRGFVSRACSTIGPGRGQKRRFVSKESPFLVINFAYLISASRLTKGPTWHFGSLSNWTSRLSPPYLARQPHFPSYGTSHKGQDMPCLQQIVGVWVRRSKG